MSFGKGRKTNQVYLGHILEVGHGSVLEHAVWNLLIVGVSRSLTHELVRHRAGFGYSQLSQRYVDESTADYIEPDCIADDPELHRIWLDAIEQTHKTYCVLVERLGQKFADEPDATLRRKLARQAARSVLPNATETKIFVTANARALRHFIELRANEHADVEIRKLAVAVLRVMQKACPNAFGDYRIEKLADGSQVAVTEHRKV
jgi:thymidylate synthase (FAD)